MVKVNNHLANAKESTLILAVFSPVESANDVAHLITLATLLI